jgi:ribosomal protein L14E/L6E/L27E
MTRAPIEVGRIVRSKAGRDSGRMFLVVGEADEQHLLIADGDLRKIAKPKKKKRRHLMPTAHVCEEATIGELKDFHIRKLIQNANDKEG